jgi:CDP-glucose 4,6-dehydratase
MFWEGRRVFLTGHTGFKGSWLSLWLQGLGADLHGYSLSPPTQPSLFERGGVAAAMSSTIGDIADAGLLNQTISRCRPEIVFHLAAQPLVRQSYEDPVGTFTTNVIGTANVLEAVRHCASVRAVVVVTSDKCYENREWLWPYREDDRLGGHDPYSNSKGCAEMVVACYRNSFFAAHPDGRQGIAIASARAGNVIGGGDWAQDRLVPDAVRAFATGHTLQIRNPRAVRPWQHVLEPLRGYLILAERLFEEGPRFSGGWNFGPEYSDARPVNWVVERLARTWGPSAQWRIDTHQHPHEAQMLKLDWSKAAQQLDWKPAFSLERALDETMAWYKLAQRQHNMRDFTLEQIDNYSQTAGYYEIGTQIGVLSE